MNPPPASFSVPASVADVGVPASADHVDLVDGSSNESTARGVLSCDQSADGGVVGPGSILTSESSATPLAPSEFAPAPHAATPTHAKDRSTFSIRMG